MYKMLVHIWPGNKLSSGMTETDKVTIWCPAEFRAKLSPTVELKRQYSEMVAISFSLSPKYAQWKRNLATRLTKEV